MKKRFVKTIIITLILLVFSTGFCQITGTHLDSLKSSSYNLPRYVPQGTTSKILWSFGGGIGLPYGVFGGKTSFGLDYFTADAGFGIFPILWSPTFSAGGTIYFTNRYNTIRPKFNAIYSNTSAVIMFYDSGSLEILYDDIFPGMGIYGGIDWRVSKTSPFCLDLNIGFVFAFEGNDEVERKFNEVKENLENQGYVMTDQQISLNTPKISIGITYSPGRSLELKY